MKFWRRVPYRIDKRMDASTGGHASSYTEMRGTKNESQTNLNGFPLVGVGSAPLATGFPPATAAAYAAEFRLPFHEW